MSDPTASQIRDAAQRQREWHRSAYLSNGNEPAAFDDWYDGYGPGSQPLHRAAMAYADLLEYDPVLADMHRLSAVLLMAMGGHFTITREALVSLPTWFRIEAFEDRATMETRVRLVKTEAPK